MSQLVDQFNRPLETMRPSERLINRFAGETLPNLIPNLKERLKSMGGKGVDMIKNAFKGPTTYNQLELKLKPASAFQEAMDLTKSQRFRPAGVLRGLGGPALGLGVATIADTVRRETAGKPGVAKMSKFGLGTGGTHMFDLLDADAPIYGDQVAQISEPNNPVVSDLETIIRMRQELDQARAAQRARADVNIVTDDPLAPPVEPPAPIDYMGALGKEMRPAPAKTMQTSYDDGSVAPFAYEPDLKAQYRAAILNPEIGTMQAMRNAEKLLGIKFAQGKYYFDSGRVDADGNPIPVDLTDKERRQLKNFEITPTALQIQKNSAQLLENPEIYDETVGSNATKMPEYPLFTADSPVNTFNEFDYADVAAALADLGEKYVPYFTDIDVNRFGF